MTDDPNYHNATLAELIGFAGADTLTGDVFVFAFRESDIGAFIEIVTGEETVRDPVIRLTAADAITLATRLLIAAEKLAPSGMAPSPRRTSSAPSGCSSAPTSSGGTGRRRNRTIEPVGGQV